MRVESGQAKGRQLKTPKGSRTRPTSSKIRASLFDILQNRIQGTHFLDLFSGSGAIGIEALSRGAHNATFVECDRSAARCISENLKICNFEAQAKLLSQPVEKALPFLAKRKLTFDFIFVDPPYDLEIQPLLEEMAPLLRSEGLIIIEQRKGAELSSPLLQETDRRTFGDTILFFFKAA